MLSEFVDRAYGRDTLATLRADLIGEGVEIPGVEGPNRLIYADYTASGRALGQVEDFIREKVLPFYANAHTNASYCGAYINKLRAQARSAVARLCNTDSEHAVIFAGAGATAAINRAAHLILGQRLFDTRPLVLVGPYEHHSNILPWRESGAEVIEISEDSDGGPNLAELNGVLNANSGRHPIVAAFSAASNVTGICADVPNINAILKRHGVITLWDYAGAGPYLPIDMQAGGGVDAVALSPHKFLGGVGGSGILIIRRSVATNRRPSITGGGTVRFVSPWAHHYAGDVTTREEAGTPNVVGDIRAALAMLIKARVGEERIAALDAEFNARAMVRWRANDRIELLGNLETWRVPVFSFRVGDGRGGYVHHQLVTRMLSDYFGVQARGGCACAGPYAHRLLDIDQARSEALWSRIALGFELDKPGWTRLNFSYCMDFATVDRIIAAVDQTARNAAAWAFHYDCEETRATFEHRALAPG